MFDYYCPNCNKRCDFDEEIELREVDFGDNYEEYHIKCNKEVQTIMKVDFFKQ